MGRPMHTPISRLRRGIGAVSLLAVGVAITLSAFADEPPYASFDRDSLAIQDNQTGLEWLRKPARDKDTKSEVVQNIDAVIVCNALNSVDAGADAQGAIGTAQAWRLPTIKELLSLVDERGAEWGSSPLFLFPNAFGPGSPIGSIKQFWSHSRATGGGFLYVDFATGESHIDPTGKTSMHVLCVRNFK